MRTQAVTSKPVAVTILDRIFTLGRHDLGTRQVAPPATSYPIFTSRAPYRGYYGMDGSIYSPRLPFFGPNDPYLSGWVNSNSPAHNNSRPPSGGDNGNYASRGRDFRRDSNVIQDGGHTHKTWSREDISSLKQVLNIDGMMNSINQIAESVKDLVQARVVPGDSGPTSHRSNLNVTLPQHQAQSQDLVGPGTGLDTGVGSSWGP